MEPESHDHLQFEIGHVLFIDIVGYSKLLIEEQREALSQLSEIVLATPQVKVAGRAGGETTDRRRDGAGFSS